jgi:hypothetical protein
MANYRIERHINAPTNVVYDLCADLRGAPDRISGIKRLEVLTEGPIRVGTRFRETREMMKKECTEEMEITAIEPGKSYTVRCESCGCDYRTTFTFAPNAGGTNLILDMKVKPISLGARIFAPIMGFLMSGMMKKCLVADLNDIQKAAESA